MSRRAFDVGALPRASERSAGRAPNVPGAQGAGRARAHAARGKDRATPRLPRRAGSKLGEPNRLDRR